MDPSRQLLDILSLRCVLTITFILTFFVTEFMFNLSLFSIYFKVSYLGTDLICEIQGYYRNKLK